MIYSFKKVTGHIIGLGRISSYIGRTSVRAYHRFGLYMSWVLYWNILRGSKEVRHDPHFLEFLPDHFKTEEMCYEALEVDPWSLKYVPDNLNSRGTCEKAVNIEPCFLVYVRDNLKT